MEEALATLMQFLHPEYEVELAVTVDKDGITIALREAADRLHQQVQALYQDVHTLEGENNRLKVDNSRLYQAVEDADYYRHLSLEQSDMIRARDEQIRRMRWELEELRNGGGRHSHPDRGSNSHYGHRGQSYYHGRHNGY